MGMLESLAHYWVRRAAAFELVVNKAKTKISNNQIYTVDEAFNDGLKLWFSAFDDWEGLFPYGKPPILYGAINPGTRQYQESIAVGFLTPNNLQNTPLIPLRGLGQATSVVVTYVPASGVVDFNIAFAAPTGASPPDRVSGDAYMVVCYDITAVGKSEGIAILLLTVI